MNAAKTMTADVKARFSIDPKRVYTAGVSGVARASFTRHGSVGLRCERSRTEASILRER